MKSSNLPIWYYLARPSILWADVLSSCLWPCRLCYAPYHGFLTVVPRRAIGIGDAAGRNTVVKGGMVFCHNLIGKPVHRHDNIYLLNW